MGELTWKDWEMSMVRVYDKKISKNKFKNMLNNEKVKDNCTASMQNEENPCTTIKISVNIKDQCVKTLQNAESIETIFHLCVGMCVCVCKYNQCIKEIPTSLC